MATLTVSANHNFTGENLGPDPIDEIEFTNAAGTTFATFDVGQFGTGNGLIADNVLITGSAGTNVIEINSITGTFSVAAWQFSNFGGSDHISFDGTIAGETITGSSKNDLISADDGADNLNGGAGDDQFVAGSFDIAAGETIDGGDDTDTLSVQSFSVDLTLAGTTVINVEILQFQFSNTSLIASGGHFGGAGDFTTVTGNAAFAQALTVNGNIVDLSGVNFTGWGGANQIITINGTSGIDTLTGSSKNDIITGGVGADIIDGGAGADQFVAVGGIAAGETIDGGDDTDTLRLQGGICDLTLAGTAITNVEILAFETNNNNLLIASGGHFGGAGDFTTVTGDAAFTQVLIVNGDSVDLSGVTFTGWGGANQTIIINGTSGIDTLTGSDKNDIIVGGLGNDIIIGGDGDDVFRYTATGDVAGAESVDGGDGLDTIEISGGAPVFGPPFGISATLTSIEALRFSGAGTTQATLNSNQIGAGAITAVTGSAGANVVVVNTGGFEDLSGVAFTDWTDGTDLIAINGTPFADNLTGTSRNDVIKGGGGSDTLNGGDGDDAFTDVGAAETVNGGNGTDTLDISGANDFSAGPTLISIEALHFSNAGTATFKGTQIGAGQITAITGSVGTNAVVVNAASDVDLSALTFTSWTNGPDTITINGTADGENLTGSSQNDAISAGDGDDTLTGGLGDDALNGGLGNDTAVFSGNRSSYTLQVVEDTIVMSGLDGTDKLRSIERLQFADGTVELVNDGSALFDTLFYLGHNPDVFAAGVDPLGHFNTFGFHEGRDPNAWFDTSGYLGVYKDVAAAGVNPLDHFHQFGWKEGRDPSANFDTTLYLINNPDVAAAGIDPLEHFLQFGISEHRSAFAAIGQKIAGGFDAEFYLWHNPDVAAAGVDPFWHYSVIGWQEGRDPNAYFDTSGYLAYYTDVAAAGINPLLHYEAVGWTEGRDPSAGFDTLGYLALHPDVAAAHVNPLDHFLQHGIYEGRAVVNDGAFG